MTDVDADNAHGSTAVALPSEHPQRLLLQHEAHARPPENLIAPLRISYLALCSEMDQREQQWREVCELCQRYEVEPPGYGDNHFSADFGSFRLKWERHTEFARYQITLGGLSEPPFADTAIAALPEDWLAALTGELLVAAHVLLYPADVGLPDDDAKPGEFFHGNPLLGSTVAAGAASAWTDFRVHADGFSRWLIHDRGMTPRQCGRTVQRLLEIDTYRMLAMLALPLARELTPELNEFDEQLSEITRQLSKGETHDEQRLLERLTVLQVAIENRSSRSAFRFGAAEAYYDLVQRRVRELRDGRIPGLQTFHEFIERRLAPAMQTCTAVARREASLLERVSRTTQLLSTRVDIIREEQTQALLESMNRRAKMQLRLQQTVEGLSVAAITYYVVGLIGYAAKSLSSIGLPANPDLVMGLSIPLVVLVLAVGVRRLRRLVKRNA